MLRDMGVSQTELREEHGYIWVVLDIKVDFKRPAKLDDELLVTAGLTWIKGVRQGFRQEITRKSDGEMVAVADLSAVMLHADSLKPARVPAWIKSKLENY
jgi:YbgC/YbaW family acyl-CoA thioester hydrolase